MGGGTSVNNVGAVKMRWFSGYAPPYIYICQARVLGSRVDDGVVGVFVPVDACRKDPSTLALRRRGPIVGGGDSLQDPGREGIEVVPRRGFVSRPPELVVGRMEGRL